MSEYSDVGFQKLLDDTYAAAQRCDSDYASHVRACFIEAVRHLIVDERHTAATAQRVRRITPVGVQEADEIEAAA